MANFTININEISNLSINNSSPDINGEGTLNFLNGQPGETLTLDFSGVVTGTSSIIFSSPVIVDILEEVNQTRPGSVVLDGSGSATSNYSIEGSDFSYMTVTITARTGSDPVPVDDSTTIEYFMG